MQIVLASGSPRRKEILERLVVEFTVQVSDFPENLTKTLPPHEYVLQTATAKTQSVYDLNQSALVIGADTVVVLDDQILEKPSSKDHAFEMLKNLSGKPHFVLTAVCLIKEGKIHSFVEQTLVTFGELSDQEILDYVATGEPMDKAGGYGYQGLGCTLVKTQSGKHDPTTTVPTTTSQPPPTTPPTTTTENHPVTSDKPPPVTSNLPPVTNSNGQVISQTDSGTSPSSSSNNNGNGNGSNPGGNNSDQNSRMSTGLIIGLSVGLGVVFIGIIILACWKSNVKSPLKTITPIKRAEHSPTIKPFDHEARPAPYYNRQGSPPQETRIIQERRPSQPERAARPVYNQQYAVYETYEDSPYEDSPYAGPRYNEYYNQDYYEYETNNADFGSTSFEEPKIDETIERGEIPIMKAHSESVVEDIQPPVIKQSQAQDTLHSIDKGMTQNPVDQHSELSKLRRMIEFASICQFFQLFMETYGYEDLDSEVPQVNLDSGRFNNQRP
ncbi:hypothetical protein HK103_001983 [Boothiomyces macroporosus]|uniref:Maf-like protein n=1 Tax=Boothiomyces macroporosus TaxID=261099 RepID=A0AAD5UA63_9FUNG|nr:hypothetical protein HK103_001983 [Boothiomyces macroporosus]